MNCALVKRYVDAFLDGELDPTALVDFEKHISLCEPCQAHVAHERALHAALRAALVDVEVPADLRERVKQAAAKAPPMVIEIRSLRRRHWIALGAAAALLVLVVNLSDFSPGTVQGANVLDDVVRVHSHQLPSDVKAQAPDQVARYFKNKVRFPVRPAEFSEWNARLIGARLSNVRERSAAALYYEVGGARVTVVVFEAAPGVRIPGQRVDSERGRVQYHNVAGYTIPVRQWAGLNYAFAGDLDRDSLIRLAASARMH